MYLLYSKLVYVQCGKPSKCDHLAIDMDGTGLLLIGMGVGTVTKSVVVHKAAPDRVRWRSCAAGRGKGGWYSAGG